MFTNKIKMFKINEYYISLYKVLHITVVYNDTNDKTVVNIHSDHIRSLHIEYDGDKEDLFHRLLGVFLSGEGTILDLNSLESNEELCISLSSVRR